MSTTTDKKISLWMSGNQVRSKGFEDLVLIKPQFPKLTYMGVPGVEACPYAFVVKIGTNYIQYTLVLNRITTSDGNPGAILKIAIGIPAKHRIAGGISPYQVLMEIRQHFVDHYMRPTLGVEGGFTYKAGVVDSSEFSDLLDRYVLESCAMPHRVMQGSEPGLLVLPETEIAELFKDVQYKEFSRFNEVVVATSANEGSYAGRVLAPVSIPRRPAYTLVVNGKNVAWPVTDIFHQLTTLKTNKDTAYFENVQISFCVKDLLEGNIPTGITFDAAEEVVYCKLLAIEKQRSFAVSVTGCDEEAAALKKVRFVLDDGTAVHVDDQGKLTLGGMQLKSKVKVEYTGTDYMISEYSQNGSTLKIVLKPNTDEPQLASGRAVLQGDQFMALNVYLIGVKEEEASFQLRMVDREREMILQQKVLFRKVPNTDGKKSLDLLNAVIPLSSSWQGKTVQVELKNKRLRTRKNIEISPLYIGENKLKINNLKETGFLDQLRDRWRLIALCLCLPLCFAFGFGVKSCLTDDKPESADALERGAEKVETKFVQKKDLMSLERCEAVMNDSTHNITFEEVFEIYSWLKGNDSLVVKVPELVERVDVYYQVASAIQSHSYAKLKAMGEKARYEEGLNEKDLWNLRGIYSGYKEADGRLHTYSEEEVKTVKIAFLNGQFTSFDDLKSVRPEQAEP